MWYRYLVSVYRVRRAIAGQLIAALNEVADELMAEKVEVDPSVRAPPLRAAQKVPVKRPRLRYGINADGQVEGRETTHRTASLNKPACASVRACESLARRREIFNK